MNRNFKLFASLLFSIMLLFLLSACVTSVQKPTGLEKTEAEQKQIDGELNPSVLDSTEEKEEPGNPIDSEKKAIVKADEQIEDEEKLTDKSTTKQREKTGKASENPVTTTPTPSASVKAPAKKPAEQEKKAESAVNTVIYSIVISTETDEIPLSPTEIEIKEGDTVLQALINVTKELGIQMDYRGGRGSTAYIEGIDNVYEFDRGQGSGWMYRVNGIFPDRGAGAISLEAGDEVEWLYTTDLGVDLNADLKPFRR